MVNSLIISFDDIGPHFFDFVENVFLKIIIFGRKTIVQISLKLRVGYFVSSLIFLIILRLFLNGIVG